MRSPNFGLEGRTAIVTGASSGIGRSIAETFIGIGVDVGICSRSMDRIGPVASELNHADGGEALAIECDVRDRTDVATLLDRTVEAFGDVDILVNNAGGGFVAPFEDLSPNAWNGVMDLNVTGTVHSMQLVGENMRDAGGGSIVNISSVGGMHANPGESHYSAAKAAVIRLTDTVAVEWAEHDIRVNGIAPGLIQTAGVADTFGFDQDEMEPRTVVERRSGYPEEIADVVTFLVSPAASYVTGETIPVKGPSRPGNPLLDDPEKQPDH
jgi:NAD(P)-dependent dehydrogenase (short-subunit alcohol dehydrogenase family)